VMAEYDKSSRGFGATLLEAVKDPRLRGYGNG